MLATLALVACAPVGPPPAPPAGFSSPALTPGAQAKRDDAYRASLTLVQGDLVSTPLAGPTEPPPLLARRRLARGVDGFREALAIDPGFWPAWWALGKTYERLGRAKDAVACLDVAFARAPESSRAAIARDAATSAEAAGDLPATIRAYETASRLDPSDPGLVAHLASAHLAAGHVDAARRVLLDYLRLHGDDVAIRRMLGRADVVERGAACPPGKPCPPGNPPGPPGFGPVIRTR